ncbi:hypothetical protein Sta7437_4490 [Stanieria cyanosphaera PCC 7437]|uniref:Uncharacterized protein n=1 Tax=Stanieria cyanosphaera (strain ATCC 29371 / PCC 7437) TaxID=111780 RepID=K9Y0W0_STAC7|nr:hypothetical protein [Stanieria cyanosphaera]AFZ37954.1 hypothetical protein Sta7437_4490 [Stanieria cyanosphaera PCC 7437]
MEQVLQWWYGRQLQRLSEEAFKIRDGLLQDSFAVRRSIELSLIDNRQISQQLCLNWLKKVEDFHHSLKNLSDRLSPPFLEDSFPLAIRHLLQKWAINNEEIKLELNLPQQWQQQSNNSGLILSFLDELLKISLATIEQQTLVKISLSQFEGINELQVQISYPDAISLARSCNAQELNYLQESFQILTLGKCFNKRQELSVTWYFHWQSSIGDK